MKWAMIRNDKITNIFENREDAIKHFRKLLKQNLKDLKPQEHITEFDYEIIIPSFKILEVEERPAYLGL